MILLVGIVYFVANYAENGKNQLLFLLNIPGSSVKGASTDRAHEISQDFATDIGKQVESAKTQAMEIKIGDIVGFFARLQKIPHDMGAMESYVKEQTGNMLESRKEK
jgi:hypothetical protein